MMGLESDVERERDGLVVRDFGALGDVPFDLVFGEPFLAGRVPVFVGFVVASVVKVLPVFDAIVMAAAAGLDDGFHTADYGSADDSGPGIDGLEDDIGVGGGCEDRGVFLF